jgi:Flp pilus assembly protein TadB
MYVMAVLTTVIALAAVVGWWRARRALTGERAARRISEAAMVREHEATAGIARRAMDRRLYREAALREADRVLDEALAQYYLHDPHNTEGDGDG